MRCNVCSFDNDDVYNYCQSCGAGLEPGGLGISNETSLVGELRAAYNAMEDGALSAEKYHEVLRRLEFKSLNLYLKSVKQSEGGAPESAGPSRPVRAALQISWNDFIVWFLSDKGIRWLISLGAFLVMTGAAILVYRTEHRNLLLYGLLVGLIAGLYIIGIRMTPPGLLTVRRILLSLATVLSPLPLVLLYTSQKLPNLTAVDAWLLGWAAAVLPSTIIGLWLRDRVYAIWPPVLIPIGAVLMVFKLQLSYWIIGYVLLAAAALYYWWRRTEAPQYSYFSLGIAMELSLAASSAYTLWLLWLQEPGVLPGYVGVTMTSVSILVPALILLVVTSYTERNRYFAIAFALLYLAGTALVLRRNGMSLSDAAAWLTSLPLLLLVLGSYAARLQREEIAQANSLLAHISALGVLLYNFILLVLFLEPLRAVDTNLLANLAISGAILAAYFVATGSRDSNNWSTSLGLVLVFVSVVEGLFAAAVPTEYMPIIVYMLAWALVVAGRIWQQPGDQSYGSSYYVGILAIAVASFWALAFPVTIIPITALNFVAFGFFHFAFRHRSYLYLSLIAAVILNLYSVERFASTELHSLWLYCAPIAIALLGFAYHYGFARGREEFRENSWSFVHVFFAYSALHQLLAAVIPGRPYLPLVLAVYALCYLASSWLFRNPLFLYLASLGSVLALVRALYELGATPEQMAITLLLLAALWLAWLVLTSQDRLHKVFCALLPVITSAGLALWSIDVRLYLITLGLTTVLLVVLYAYERGILFYVLSFYALLGAGYNSWLIISGNGEYAWLAMLILAAMSSAVLAIHPSSIAAYLPGFCVLLAPSLYLWKYEPGPLLSAVLPLATAVLFTLLGTTIGGSPGQQFRRLAVLTMGLWLIPLIASPFSGASGYWAIGAVCGFAVLTYILAVFERLAQLAVAASVFLPLYSVLIFGTQRIDSYLFMWIAVVIVVIGGIQLLVMRRDEIRDVLSAAMTVLITGMSIIAVFAAYLTRIASSYDGLVLLAVVLFALAGFTRHSQFGLLATMAALSGYYRLLLASQVGFSIGVYLLPMGLALLAWSVYYSYRNERQIASGIGVIGAAVALIPAFLQSLPWVSQSVWDVVLAIAACLITVVLSIFARIRLCLMSGTVVLVLVLLIRLGAVVANLETGWTIFIGGVVLLALGIFIALKRESIARYPELWAKLTEEWI